MASPLATWHHLDIIVAECDIEGVRHHMTDLQLSFVERAIGNLSWHVPEMSNGMCRIVQSVHHLRSVLRRRTKSGNAYSINWTNDLRALVELEKVDHATYDSISAWIANEAIGSGAAGGGLTAPARELSATGKGGGFSAIYLASDTGDPNKNLSFPNTPIHEWLHQSVWYYPQFFSEFRPQVNIDSPFNYQHVDTGEPWTSANYSAGQPFTGYTFMSAVMQGKVALISNPSDPLGISPEAWAKPSPRG